MSKQEATNTFTDGLIMDLNEITTPDNILTDNLNGTIITYDGNEFVLQNDQGNFKLKNARLSPNFIPVGVKEYGDILYIVSHNPLTKETEVGSYPSPQTIFSTKDKNHIVNFIPIIPDNTTVYDTYENLTKNIKLQMYSSSNDNDSYMLNPGDKFRLEINENLQFKYQSIKFYVLSEDKKLYKIEIPSEYRNQLEFKNVFWQIPGWLCGRYGLANLDQFYLNIRNLSLPEFISGGNLNLNIDLNSQLEITDELFLSSNTLQNDLKVELILKVKDKNGVETYQTTIISTTLSKYNYNNASSTYYYNFNQIPISNLSIDDTISVSAVPMLQYGDDTVVYEQFRTNLEFNLKSVSDASEIDAANIIYRYITDSDSVQLTFNVTGPFINNSDIEVHYDIINLNGTKVISNQKLTDLNLFGQNTIDIEFSGGFQPEDIYLFIIRFSQNGIELRNINKILIPSVTFNSFNNLNNEYNSQIFAEQWLRKLKDNSYFDNTTSLNKLSDTNKVYFSDPILNPDGGNWPSKYIIQSSIPPQSVIYKAGLKYDANYLLTKGFKTLTGNLWDNMNNQFKFNYSYNNGEIIKSNTLNNNLTENVNFNLELYYKSMYDFIENAKIFVPSYKKTYFKDMFYGGSKFMNILFSWYLDSNSNNNKYYKKSFYHNVKIEQYDVNENGQFTTLIRNFPNYAFTALDYGGNTKPQFETTQHPHYRLGKRFMDENNLPFLLCEIHVKQHTRDDNKTIVDSNWDTPVYFVLVRMAGYNYPIPLSLYHEDKFTVSRQEMLDTINQWAKYNYVITNYTPAYGESTVFKINEKTRQKFDSIIFDYTKLELLFGTPMYNLHGLNANLYTQVGMNSIINKIKTIENSLTQVNVKKIQSFNNLTFSINPSELNGMSLTKSFDIDSIIYSLENDTTIQDMLVTIDNNATIQKNKMQQEYSDAVNNKVTRNGVFQEYPNNVVGSENYSTFPNKWQLDNSSSPAYSIKLAKVTINEFLCAYAGNGGRWTGILPFPSEGSGIQFPKYNGSI